MVHYPENLLNLQFLTLIWQLLFFTSYDHMFAPNMYQNIIYIHVLLVIQIMSIPDFDNRIFLFILYGGQKLEASYLT